MNLAVRLFGAALKVTLETIGQAPRLATISSAPSPFWMVKTTASVKRPAMESATAPTCIALVAMTIRSGVGIAETSVVASSFVLISDLPDTVSPRSFSSAACSGRRTSTETSATWPRWAAHRLRSNLHR